MPVYWIVREHEGQRTVFIESAGTPTAAFLKSAIAGHEGGSPLEYHELDDKTVRAIPKSMTGRPLNSREARDLLKKMAGR